MSAFRVYLQLPARSAHDSPTIQPPFALLPAAASPRFVLDAGARAGTVLPGRRRPQPVRLHQHPRRPLPARGDLPAGPAHQARLRRGLAARPQQVPLDAARPGQRHHPQGVQVGGVLEPEHDHHDQRRQQQQRQQSVQSKSIAGQHPSGSQQQSSSFRPEPVHGGGENRRADLRGAEIRAELLPTDGDARRRLQEPGEFRDHRRQ